MNINISSILSNSLRILNIANKAIPLIKDFNPTIKKVKDSLKKVKFIPNNQNVNNTPIQEIKESKKIVYQDNSLTFFR